MELTPKAQVVELLRQSQNILILTHTDPDGDALGSVLALKMTLEKIGKTVDSIFSGRVDPTFDYLPHINEVKSKEIAASNDLVLTVDTRNTGEDLKLGYKKLTDDHQIQIVITPPKGTLLPDDVKIERSLPKYDAVVILDAPTFERIGPIFTEFPDLFFETPTIVIDHHVTNAYPAKINWVDMTATSTAEMLVALIEAIGRGENMLDEAVATCLLTGLITDTGSFQNMNTTPKALTVAAQLVAAGANHQEIVEKIRTKSLTKLKLWGKALGRIKENTDLRYVWTVVEKTDLTETGASSGEESGLIDELLKSVNNVDFVMVISQVDEGIKANLRSVVKGYDVSAIAENFGGGGHKAAAGFKLSGEFKTLKNEVIEQIDQYVATKELTGQKSVSQQGAST